MAFTTIQGSDKTSIIGTLGRDSVVLNSQANAYVGAQAEVDAITANGATSATTIKGGQGNDSIIQAVTGTFTDSLVNGNKGADTISIHSANNTKIYGGQGLDQITANNITNGTKVNGNKGVDSIYVTNADTSSVYGGAGEDTLVLKGSLLKTTIDGNKEADTITLDATSNLNLTSVYGGTGGDTITVNTTAGFTNSTILGGDGDDAINAVSATSAIAGNGQAGADSLTGGSGADSFGGGAGNDQLDGNAGADSLNGGDGNDTFVYATAAEFIDGTLVDAVMAGGDGTDRIQITGATTIAATVSFAKVTGVEELYTLGTGAQSLDLDVTAQTAGIATVNVSTATSASLIDVSEYTTLATSLTGSVNADTLKGGAAADTITSGGGADTITAAGGADSIVLTETTAASDTVVTGATASANGADVITGFATGATADGGDVLNIDAFLDAAAMNAEATANPDDATVVDSDVNLLVDIEDGQDITTAAGLNTALAADGEYANINMGASKKAVFVTAASATTTTLNVFFATSDADAAITAVLVGTITTTEGDIGDLVAANFNIA